MLAPPRAKKNQTVGSYLSLPGQCLFCHSSHTLCEKVGDIVCRKCGKVQQGRVLLFSPERMEYDTDSMQANPLGKYSRGNEEYLSMGLAPRNLIYSMEVDIPPEVNAWFESDSIQNLVHLIFILYPNLIDSEEKKNMISSEIHDTFSYLFHTVFQPYLRNSKAGIQRFQENLLRQKKNITDQCISLLLVAFVHCIHKYSLSQDGFDRITKHQRDFSNYFSKAWKSKWVTLAKVRYKELLATKILSSHDTQDVFVLTNQYIDQEVLSKIWFSFLGFVQKQLEQEKMSVSVDHFPHLSLEDRSYGSLSSLFDSSKNYSLVSKHLRDYFQRNAEEWGKHTAVFDLLKEMLEFLSCRFRDTPQWIKEILSCPVQRQLKKAPLLVGHCLKRICAQFNRDEVTRKIVFMIDDWISGYQQGSRVLIKNTFEEFSKFMEETSSFSYPRWFLDSQKKSPVIAVWYNYFSLEQRKEISQSLHLSLSGVPSFLEQRYGYVEEDSTDESILVDLLNSLMSNCNEKLN